MTYQRLLEPTLYWTMLVSMAAILLMGVLHKIRNLPAWLAAVAAYDLVPDAAVKIVALGVAATELASGVLLLLPATRDAAAAMTMLLLIIVSTAVVAKLAQGHDGIDCGCGAPGHVQRLSWGLVCRNGVLLAAAGMIGSEGNPGPLGIAESMIAACGIAGLLGIYAMTNQVLASTSLLRT